MSWASTLHSLDTIVASDIGYVVYRVLAREELEFFEIRKQAIISSTATAVRWDGLMFVCPWNSMSRALTGVEYRRLWHGWSENGSYERRSRDSAKQHQIGLGMIEAAFGIGCEIKKSLLDFFLG